MGRPRSKGFSRTKTGCLTCRQRRKKCDELKPTCTGCARNFIHCSWPSPRDAQRTSPRSRSLSTSTTRSVYLKKSDSGLLLPLSPISCSISSSLSNSTSTSSINNNSTTTSISNSDNQDTTLSFDNFLTSWEPPSPAITDVDVEPESEDEHAETMIRWHPILSSFISAERAVVRTPSSPLLLRHYLQATSTFLVAKPLSSNPFVTVVLPLAWSDDLLMHSVLALSGAHLSHTSGGNLDIQLATRQHYSLLLRNLRSAFAGESSAHEDVRRTLRLLLVLAVVCHIEVSHLSFFIPVCSSAACRY